MNSTQFSGNFGMRYPILCRLFVEFSNLAYVSNNLNFTIWFMLSVVICRSQK